MQDSSYALQGRRFYQCLERRLTSSKRKEIDRGIRYTRLPRGYAIQPQPAVTHPDGSGRHTLSHVRSGLENAALVQQTDLFAIFDLTSRRIDRCDPDTGFWIEFG